MPQTKVPSPARSQGATTTPKRKNTRGSRSLCSPALSTASGRLTSLIDQFKDKNMESFALSPFNGRSVLNDDTEIEEPRRKSWWQKLDDNSQDVMEVLEDNKLMEVNNVIEELIDIEILSQEKNNYTLDLPESSDESINSIVLPQRKLFTQKENVPEKKFGQFAGNRESLAKLHKAKTTNIEKTVNVEPRVLFQNTRRSKVVFPADLLKISPKKTATDKTKKNMLAKPIPEVIPGSVLLETSRQEKNNYTLDLPESSDGSINSIVLEQRKLFTQKEDQPQKKFGQFVGNRESLAKIHKTNTTNIEKTVNVGTRELFQNTKGSKVVFPAALLKISPKKTATDKTKENLLAEPIPQVRNIFGNRPASKRKNTFADFIVSESEDEIPDIQPKVFGFQRKLEQRRISAISKGKDWSPTSSITTDIEMEDWKLLPSSTMVEMQLEDMMAPNTPIKRARLSKLSEAKESEAGTITLQTNTTADKTKQSNKSVTSKNKSKSSPEIKDRSLNNSRITRSMLKNTSKHEENTSVKQDKGNKSQSKISSKGNELDISPPKSEDRDKQNTTLNKSKTQNKSKTTTTKHNKSSLSNNSIQKELKPAKTVEESVESQNEQYSADDNVDGNLEQEPEIGQNQESYNEEKVSQEIDERVNNSRSNEEHVSEKNEKATEGGANQENADEANESEEDEANVSQENESEHNESQEEANQSQDVENEENETKEVEDEANESDEQEIENEVNESKEAEDEANESDEHEVENEVNESKEVEDEANESYEQEVENEVNESKEVEDEANESYEQEVENEVNESKEAEDEANESDEHEDEANASDVNEETNDSQEVENEINESQEIEEEANQSQEINEEAHKSYIVEDDNASDEEMNEEAANKSQEVENDEEESHEVDSDADVNESKEIADDQQMVDSDEADKAIASDPEISDEDDNPADEMEVDDDDENDESEQNQHESHEECNEIEPSAEETEESPDVTHDTTGRHRKKDLNKSPEVILHDKTNQMDSFTAKGRNTSVRKTKSMIKSLNIRPSLAPRDSIGFSDGTKNSSAEGSGWDSHRTTRKTMRQTFGKDFTPRKSLRTLVMEKAAKRQTEHTDMHSETVKYPQANSTELPEDSYNHVEDIVESDHEVSRRTRQATLEMYLQKIKQENFEKRQKMEEAIRNSLKGPVRDPLSLFKVPNKPAPRRPKPTQNKPKKQIKSVIPLDELPSEFIEDIKYKPPKRFKPPNAAWITKRLYKFLESKLEPKYDYKARVRAEKLVETIYHFAKDTLRRQGVASTDAVEVLKHELARLDIVQTHFEFYDFFHEFMPRELRVKVNPDIVNKIPLPRHGVFSNILREDL